MTKDKVKTQTVLTGTDNFDIWRSRMKLRLKSKGLTELLSHGKDNYAMVLEEKKMRAREKIECIRRLECEAKCILMYPW